jgi:hypothetical protein
MKPDPMNRQARRRAEREARKEAERRHLDWTDPKVRAAMIGVLHAGLAQDEDPTLAGVTLILPDGKGPLYIAKADAKRRPKPGTSDA